MTNRFAPLALGAALVAALAGPGWAQQARHASQETVRQVQRSLGELGFAPGGQDGIMGAQTRSAITSFQRARGLNQTGELSPETLDALGVAPAHAHARPQIARAVLRDVRGNGVGEVTLTEMARGLILRAELSGLPEGWHGFHIHQIGRCDPPFDSAGPHYNPRGQKHGLGHAGAHAGDLPNIYVDANGRAKVEMILPQLTLSHPQVASSGSGGSLARFDPLLDSDGAALVVHAEADDHVTDPSGKSGGRIACGVLIR